MSRGSRLDVLVLHRRCPLSPKECGNFLCPDGGSFFRLVLAQPTTWHEIRRLFVSKAVDKQMCLLSDISAMLSLMLTLRRLARFLDAATSHSSRQQFAQAYRGYHMSKSQLKFNGILRGRVLMRVYMRMARASRLGPSLPSSIVSGVLIDRSTDRQILLALIER